MTVMDAAVEALAVRVIDLAGDPIDRWAVAVAIESFGLAETSPAAGARASGEAPAAHGGAPQPLFPLADAVYAECLRRRAARPEVTVAMPAYNRAGLIGDAIRSVLAQEGIDLELIVVDDGSSDDTAAVAAGCGDPRVVVVRNAVNRGIWYCHNLVVARSRAPFIAHVDSDDVILPGALRRVVDRAASSADYGQAHGLYAFADASATIERDEMRRQWSNLHQRRAGLDYREALLRHGSVMNHLRVYRREVFDVSGGFDAKYRHGEDLELALRLLETHDIAGVPEIVYIVRRHHARTTRLRFASLRFWLERVAMVRVLVRRRAISYPRTRRYRAERLLLRGLPTALGIPRALASVRSRLAGAKARVARWLRRTRRAAGELAYRSLVRLLARWPAPRRRTPPAGTTSTPRGAAGGTAKQQRVVYYLWQYPVASQTFIRRELAALLRRGIGVLVVSEERGADTGVELDGAPAPVPLGDVDRRRMIAFLLRLMIKRPWSAPSLGLWMVGRRYGPVKTWREDLTVLGRAVRLAVVLEREGASRVHAPWADRSALVARLAAAMVRIPYSVHGRAHELQRERSRIGLPDRLGGADFVVCGAQFAKERLLAEVVPPSVPVHVVYEGVVPARLAPRLGAGDRRGPLRLLTVARLIEEKGIRPLLATASELHRRGVAVTWRVVGGADEPASTSYLLEVLRLHRRLGLEDLVRFTGALPFEQVVEEYRSADVFVLPCVTASNGGRDVTPNSILEAMAMELPVVSSRQTAIPELAPDGECALLVEPGDVEGLTGAVARLAESADLRRSLGARGRARVMELFDVDRNTAALARLFAGRRDDEPVPAARNLCGPA